jgi:hypothetical protein
MLKLFVFIAFFGVLAGLIGAYSYLILINRENEMPGIEDVETLPEDK